ncbi:hypothetical protein I7I50_07611 [Histoplasma capsulatum G186AR]|uniref:Uncharacterized protein n=1 Tax=Ajellomyces capsulatus TaxID=5037 RepID=A0A8H8D2F7_AJECA|nr:hypothetical protein I7I52_09317 [Histoplasma capsulatum]QSS68260.1 hypothetical protein I7I50_07611 [Histoplasma capsulatum G186AR]
MKAYPISIPCETYQRTPYDTIYTSAVEKFERNIHKITMDSLIFRTKNKRTTRTCIERRATARESALGYHDKPNKERIAYHDQHQGKPT